MKWIIKNCIGFVSVICEPNKTNSFRVTPIMRRRVSSGSVNFPWTLRGRLRGKDCGRTQTRDSLGRPERRTKTETTPITCLYTIRYRPARIQWACKCRRRDVLAALLSLTHSPRRNYRRLGRDFITQKINSMIHHSATLFVKTTL